MVRQFGPPKDWRAGRVVFDVDWEDGKRLPEAVTLMNHEAQVLMDSLWECGLRPSQGAGSAGAMDATQKHLEDMRLIAFRGLGMDKGK